MHKNCIFKIILRNLPIILYNYFGDTLSQRSSNGKNMCSKIFKLVLTGFSLSSVVEIRKGIYNLIIVQRMLKKY